VNRDFFIGLLAGLVISSASIAVLNSILHPIEEKTYFGIDITCHLTDTLVGNLEAKCSSPNWEQGTIFKVNLTREKEGDKQ